MALHIGEKIKARSAELRIGPTEFGMLIHTSKQNVHGIYKRRSIDTELLRKISEALDFDFFSYYTESALVEAKEPGAPYNKPIKNLADVRQEIALLKKEILELQEKYQALVKPRPKPRRK